MAFKRLSIFLLVCALVAPLLEVVVLSEANAGSKARTRPVPQRCFTLAKKVGPSRVWWGRHTGYRDIDPMFKWGPTRETVNEIACFKTRKQCEDWLYWMRTDYPHSTHYRPCRRGL